MGSRVILVSASQTRLVCVYLWLILLNFILECEYEETKTQNTENLVHSLRKQSDLQLIRCVNDISQNSYIVKVPLHPLTLFFKDKKTEKDYRANAHKIHEKRGDSPATLSTSR